MDTAFQLGVDRLTPARAVALAADPSQATLSAGVRERMAQARREIDAIAAGDSASYGINTGFGPLCATVIPAADRARLQEKLLLSHSVGVGELIPVRTARLMLLLKLHALALGHSGVSEPVVERIRWLLAGGYAPAVPEQGSVGASGDLAPLAHLFLPLIGEGALLDADAARPTPTTEVYARHGLSPLRLAPKDGLALINGTQFIAAHACEAYLRLGRCLEVAAQVGAMMVDGLQASHRPFDERLHALRPHRGAVEVAAGLREQLRGSRIPAAHADCARVQDPYSLRCMPQVHGASRDAWRHLGDALTVELNAVTDNPVLVGPEEVLSGGSFHGQPLALPVDYACLAAAELGSISERRINLSLTGGHPGVPRLLVRDAGLDSGFMIVQYAAAALASENKSLCFPASADSIPTGLGQEDHVSMGAHGARKLLRVVGNLERILAIEALCAAQALDFQRPLRSGGGVEVLHARLRAAVPHATEDRVFADDIEACRRVLFDGD